MSDTIFQLDDHQISLLREIAIEGVNHAVEGLSAMIGETLMTSDTIVTLEPVLNVTGLVGGPENEVVGIYLKTEGQMAGQFMLIVPIDKALELIDLLMGDPAGTATDVDDMGRSALAEVGNLTGSYFLNSVALMTGFETLPTPPAVMVDMVGAIMNIIVATAAEVVDQIVVIRTGIMHGDREVELYFWYVPDAQAMVLFIEKADKNR